MKILRLSLFNIKKNKREAAAIAFLTMVTVLMLAVFAANNSKVNRVFDESFKASGSVGRLVLFKDDTYHAEFKSILENDYKTDRLAENKYIFAGATDVRDKAGDIISYNFLFTTEKTERKLESFLKTEAITDEELKTASHPLWLPVNFKITKKYSVGDTFTIVKGGKDYPFTIAGFYETGLESSDGFGFKVILSDEDYELFSTLFKSGSMLGYNCIGLSFDSDDFDYEAYIDKCEKTSSENLINYGVHMSYEDEKNNETMFANMFLILVAFLSAITMISALFMIRHKISNDIEDQMQQIGVLEALGYRASEISLAYLYEYVISGGIGCLLGIIAACISTPFMNSFCEAMLGRMVYGNTEAGKIIAVALIIFVLVILFALLKTGTVKKYPPVIAFRKGIGTHHFGKNLLPLERSKGNINLRLAMKSLLTDLKSCIGVSICIITAGLTILFSMVSFDFFKDGTKGLESMMGIDTDVVMVSVMTGVDPEVIRDEIVTMPEVRKAYVTYDLYSISIKGSDFGGTVQAYNDYKETENIFPISGRCPEHDNEVMISYRRARMENLNIGDSLILESGGLEKSYVITGITSSMLNSGSSIYLTSDGYRRVNFNVRPNVIYVYLNEGITDEEFEDRITEMYGISAKDAMNDTSSSGTLEDKIRAAADEKIATMLSQYGVTSVDYAIRIGDKLITGNSRPFVIKEVSSWKGIIKSQIAPISEIFKKFTLLSGLLITVIVAVILSIIAASTVRRQRLSLGIMKGLGYSSGDLMKQMALRIMPVIIVSLIIASIGTVYFDRFFWFAVIGLIAKTNISVIIITDIALVIFCYAVTYISAGRIRKISVNELMTE